MAGFYIPKQDNPHYMHPLQVMRDDGWSLSFTADDNLGRNKMYFSRTYLAVFDESDNCVSNDYAVTPEEYLKALADFLGFDVVKK